MLFSFLVGVQVLLLGVLANRNDLNKAETAGSAYKIRSLDYGSFRGFQSQDSQTITFYNIPFAAPPVGHLRFRPPQPPLNISHLGVHDSTRPGPSCMVDLKNILNVGARPSEDCLQLNIIAPITAKRGSYLPVFVHVYGGAFYAHYSSFPLYMDGARRIIQDDNEAVIVTMNYRIGAFGFLQAKELESEGALNLGIQDMAAAFQWVRKYINEFGGNPNLVTGSGHSSGGIGITTLLMAHDGTLDLFDRAFMQSGFYGPHMETTESSSHIVDTLGDLTQCNGPNRIECLRSLSAEDLLHASEETQNACDPVATIWLPIIGSDWLTLDYNFVPRQQRESLQMGLFRKIPIMITTAADEGGFFIPSKPPKSNEEISAFHKKLFPFMRDEMLVELDILYPPVPSLKNIAKTMSDYLFNCPARNLAKSYASFNQPVYRGIFNHSIGIANLPLSSKFPVIHGMDLAFWWMQTQIMGSKEASLSRAMTNYWISFGKCEGLENCIVGGNSKSPEWPEYSTMSDGARINFIIPVIAITIDGDNMTDTKCEFLERAVLNRNLASEEPTKSSKCNIRDQRTSNTQWWVQRVNWLLHRVPWSGFYG